MKTKLRSSMKHELRLHNNNTDRYKNAADSAICDVGNSRIGEDEAVTVLEDLLHTGGQAAGPAGEGEAGLILGRFEVKRYHEPAAVLPDHLAHHRGNPDRAGPDTGDPDVEQRILEENGKRRM